MGEAGKPQPLDWSGGGEGLGWSWPQSPRTPFLDPNQKYRIADRQVGIFWDVADLWAERTQPELFGRVAAKLKSVAQGMTTLPKVRSQAVVSRGQLCEDERARLEALDFSVHDVERGEESAEQIAIEVLLWIYDHAIEHGASAPDPCVILVTSSQKLSRLLAMLHTRKVYVLLITEVSGWRHRQPVGANLRTRANLLFDWNRLCDLAEHEVSDEPPPPPAHEMLPSSSRTPGPPSRRKPQEASLAIPERLRNQTFSCDSIDLDGELDLAAQLDLRMSMRSGWEGGPVKPERILQMDQSLIRSETETLAIKQLRSSFIRLEDCWKQQYVEDCTHELRRLAKAGHDMTLCVQRLLTNQPIMVEEEQGKPKVRTIPASQFHFALDCLKHLYERTYSRSKSSVFRLNAAHFIVEALEECDVSSLLSEEVHHVVLDLVHNLLKQTPAFHQADRLLKLIRAREHMDILRPYVVNWMRRKDDAEASAQAYTFAYTTGLSDLLRESDLQNGSFGRSSVDFGALDAPPGIALPPPQVQPSPPSHGQGLGLSAGSQLPSLGSLLGGGGPGGFLLWAPQELATKIPETPEERIMELLTKHKEGLLGSDIPRFYFDEYGLRLELPESAETHEKMKLKDYLLSIRGVGTYTRNTQPVFIALTGDEDIDRDNPEDAPPVDHALTRERLLALLREYDAVLGAQLPSKYLETYDEPLRLEDLDGNKVKLKEYLLSEEMGELLSNQIPPLKLNMVKAGHDRRYTLQAADE